ncbi:MAG: hypothetical protein ACO35E_11440 [Ilumatobacteraceae bacterium]
MRTIVLDNEAVRALTDPAHTDHRAVVAHLAGAVSRRRRGIEVDIVVPTSVRVEAGWDRSTPSAAAIDRMRVRDHVLDTPAANVAAGIQARTGVGPTDAHIGATVRSVTAGDVVVLTSDPAGIAAASADAAVTVRIIRI